MIRSSSSSLLNGILIFLCLFGAGQLYFGAEETGKLLLQHIELFGQFGALGGYLAAALFTASPSLRDFTISSTLRTE